MSPDPPLRPGRTITGYSALLLPWHDGAPDWAAFDRHASRTAEAGLVPAVNMDTGYVNLIDDVTRFEALDRASAVSEKLVAGAHVHDEPGAAFQLDAYLHQIEAIQARGATPVVFPSHGLTGHGGDRWVEAHEQLSANADQLIAFELAPAFADCGRIFDIEHYASLLEIPQVVGAKHSSLHREPEWQRLALRDRVRPDFMVLTGNDLAIDMVKWGSDYLLGLSSFAPDLFAERDRLWADQDRSFHELNDTLQYLGQFAFRPPVPAYKHAAAIFLELRGWLRSDETPPGAPRRGDSDRAVLADIAGRLEVLA